MKITIKWLVYCLIGLCIAAFFGIALKMQFTAMVPIIFMAIIAFAIERMRKSEPFPVKEALLNAVVPVLIGGIYIQLCLILEIWLNV